MHSDNVGHFVYRTVPKPVIANNMKYLTGDFLESFIMSFDTSM